MSQLKIIECPRDAMQGMEKWIPTEEKIIYLKQLLKVGFDTIDFGSFVSPKAIPQLKDTAEVLSEISSDDKGPNKLLAIVANERGAEDAVEQPLVDLLGFPLSLSETFQKRNTNKTIEQAFEIIGNIQAMINGSARQQVVYLSMGFGNPYGDPYNEKYILEFVEKLVGLDVKTISLADTIGVSDPDRILDAFNPLIPAFPNVEFGAHLHSTPDTSVEKIQAILDAGCTRIDSAIKGFGGCPMAKDELVGNLDTITVLSVLKKNGVGLDHFSETEFAEAEKIASEIFPD